MSRKKQVLAAVGIVSVVAASLTVLVYAATWTPDQLADWMFNVGRHKIWMTNYIVRNEIKPTVYDIDEKMGQGLVGEWEPGEHITDPPESWEILWGYYVPADNPKKVSFWIWLGEMGGGDEITIEITYNAAAGVGTGPIMDTPTRRFTWTFNGRPTKPGILMIDELPVATTLFVYYTQNVGTPFKIYYHHIIEEL